MCNTLDTVGVTRAAAPDTAAVGEALLHPQAQSLGRLCMWVDGLCPPSDAQTCSLYRMLQAILFTHVPCKQLGVVLPAVHVKCLYMVVQVLLCRSTARAAVASCGFARLAKAKLVTNIGVDIALLCMMSFL